MPPIQNLWDRLNRDERIHESGSDFFCHAILDMLVDDYIPHLDELGEEIDNLEDSMLASPDAGMLQRILELKHHLMGLRRVISPMREMINRLSRDEFNVIDARSRIYFRDIYDHLVRINDMIDIIRDMTSSTLDVYLNSTSLRLNEVMKALTIVSTIFLPLSFIAAVYGMNFRSMPELAWRWGYPAIWLIFFVIVLAMLIFFRRRKWF